MECSQLAGERVKPGIDVDQARKQPTGAIEEMPSSGGLSLKATLPPDAARALTG